MANPAAFGTARGPGRRPHSSSPVGQDADWFCGVRAGGRRSTVQLAKLSDWRVAPIGGLLALACLSVAACLSGLACSSGLVWGQEERVWDRIEFRQSAAEGVRTLSGIVRDVQPGFVEVEVPSGGRRRLDRADVLSIQLMQQKELVAAENWAAQGQFERAKQAFESVIKLDVPHWLRRHAATRRLQCLRALQQYRAAVADFGTLVQDDPNRVPWEAAPLVWTGVPVDALLQEQIEQWLQSPRPWEQLAAASLGLQHPPTAAASQKVLESLAAGTGATRPNLGGAEAGTSGGSRASENPVGAGPLPNEVAFLAEAQLWRVPQRYSVEQLQELQNKVESWPTELRAGPLYLLGKSWKNTGQLNLAADAMLQVATLYPEQHDLVLLGLEAAYTTLRTLDPAEATRVGQWLVQLHPESGQADEIQRELGR